MDNNTIEIQSQVPGGLWAGTIIPQEMATLPMLITLVSIKGFSGMLMGGNQERFFCRNLHRHKVIG